MKISNYCMNCCYRSLKIHVEITDLDSPDDEHLVRERNEMAEEDYRMLTLRRIERRAEENRRRNQEDQRRIQEAQQRQEEVTRIHLENIEYTKFQAYADKTSIYYIHPLTIDLQLYRRIDEEARWKEEDLRKEQEDLRRQQEDQVRKREDTHKHTRRILVKAKRTSKRYTLQEVVQKLTMLEPLKTRE